MYATGVVLLPRIPSLNKRTFRISNIVTPILLFVIVLVITNYVVS